MSHSYTPVRLDGHNRGPGHLGEQRVWKRWHIAVVGATVSLLAIISLARLSPSLPGVLSASAGANEINQASLDNIYNSTLGFQKLLVINLPARSDHRDGMTLAGALTGIQFDWIDGINGTTVPDTALPIGNAQRLTSQGRGSWRAHMNAIRTIVEQNLGSAVILEDDVDWDVRIKDQLRDFALSTRALIQPLRSKPGSFQDPTFPGVQDVDLQPSAMDFRKLPKTVQPTQSPYGDDWDILWFGHCGMRRPTTDLQPPWTRLAKKIPKGCVVHEDDPSVPEPRYLTSYDNEGHPRFRADFRAHTRVAHHSLDGICSLAYAVSQSGARKLLYELAVHAFDDYFDIMLRQFCDGQNRHSTHTCLTVQPTIVEHHHPAWRDKDGLFHKALTSNIQWSTRLNIPKLLVGNVDFQDQFPNTDSA